MSEVRALYDNVGETMMAYLTLDEFRATGRDCDDLGKALSDTSMGETVRGRLYAGSLYIIRRPESGWIDGDQREWDLVIANQEWISDDLPRLEAVLYEFALSEGIAEYDARDELDGDRQGGGAVFGQR